MGGPGPQPDRHERVAAGEAFADHAAAIDWGRLREARF
jgi:hypothetical protein